MVRKPDRFRLYDVTVWMGGRGDPESSHTEVYSARTPVEARYQAWLDFSDVFSGVKFREFLSISEVRVSAEPLRSDGYEYIRKAYGVDPRVGQRVEFGRPGEEPKRGTILYPSATSSAYLIIGLDGKRGRYPFHPREPGLRLLEEGESQL